MRILILYNLAQRLKKGVPSDLACEHEVSIVVPMIEELLRSRGHTVTSVAATLDLWEYLRGVKTEIDIVFNLAEGFGGTNSNEPCVPAILEALEIPFTGASSANMNLTLDKEKTKLVVMSYGIPVPDHEIFRLHVELHEPSICYPLIVKPIREEASIGIHESSVVADSASLFRQIKHIHATYRQPAIVEQFVIGREISIGMIGNGHDATVLPPLEFLFPNARSSFDAIRSYGYKWGGEKEVMIRANLPKGVEGSLKEYARIAFVATECRDYARMDFRLDINDKPYLLEVNYNPGIGPNAHGLNNTLTMMASFIDVSFDEMIEKILTIAYARYH